MATNKEIKKTLNGLMDFTKGVGTAAVNAKNVGLTEDKVKNAGLTTDETKAIINGLPTYDTAKEAAAKNAAWDAYKNREKFSYDLNADAFYNQYKDRYTQLGKQAMEDTVGQMSALTGGYGNTYAQTAGQQAYNQYMQQLNDVAPELYRAARERYDNEGDKLLDVYNAEAAAEAERYGRYADEYGRQLGLRQSAENKMLEQRAYEDEKTEKAQALAQENAYRMIDNGEMPPASLLAAAGIDPKSAQAQVNAYKENKAKTEQAEADSKVMYLAELGIMPDSKLIKASSYDSKYIKGIVNKAKNDKAEQKAAEDKATANEFVLMMAQAGIMPDGKTIKASDYSEKDVKAIVNKANELSAASSSTGGGSGKSSTGTGTSGKSGKSSSGNSSSSSSSSATGKGYNNGKLSTDQVKKMQKYYGLDADGKWGPNSQSVTGMSADEAWAAMSTSAKTDRTRQDNVTNNYAKSSKDASAAALTKTEFARRKSANGGTYTAYGVECSTYTDYLESMAAAYMKTDGWTQAQAESWINSMMK